MNNDFNEELVQPLELVFLSKILEDNSRFLHTKVSAEYLKDPLVRTVYSIAGLSISKLGQFQPYIHLADLCKDEARLEKYKSLKYPLDFSEPSEIIHYVEGFKNETVKFETIEDELTKRWTKEKLEDIANEILENLDNSKIHPAELMIKMSGVLDTMIYQTHESTVTKTASEVSDDFLTYLASDDVVTYTPCGIDAIDAVSGGTPQSCVVSWVSPAKCGKSTLLVESIVNNLKNGRVCAAFTIEMNIESFMQRIYCNYASVPYEKIVKKTYTLEEKQKLIDKTIEFKELYSSSFFIYFTTDGLTCKHIEAYVANIKKAGISVQDIFIDYVQILDSYTKNNAPKPEKMAEIPKEIRLLRQKTNARIITPMQSLTSSRDKAIENWSPDDIYYSKEAEREFDYIAAMKKEDGYIKWKLLVSRFTQEDEVRFFPDQDFSFMYFGESAEWSDEYKLDDNANANDVALFEPNSWNAREKR